MNATLEEQLVGLLVDQQHRYHQAARLTAQLLAALKTDQDPTAPLHAMQQKLDEVAFCDRQILPVRQAWRKQGSPPGPRLRQVLSELQQALEHLIGQVTAAEEKATLAKQRLQPQLEEATRHGQMRRAYQGT